MKKILALVLVATLLLCLVACGKNYDDALAEATKISFKSATSYEELKKLDGKTVAINGYMATSSPVDGGYLFLMNLPYQSCPFCVPNTSQLSNTMAVYAKNGKSFDYTAQAIKIVGTLVVAESEDQPFSDKYGYEFSFKIVDAEYRILTDDEMTADLLLWQKIADSGIMDQMYSMYDYLNFVCKWPTYYVNTYTASDGTVVKGYYLWPSDALRYLQADGSDAYSGYVGQYHYGYVDGYFDQLAAKIEALGIEEASILITNVMDAKALAERALLELENGNYTFEEQYIEQFDNTDNVYTLIDGDQLSAEWADIYSVFEMWLAALET